ncbi:tyrosine aminotransferase [Sphaeroforma arctica JP610]|uniref:Tyrosine aminotransferase n=1 Tax=Sphaeroforma arctica JP610 TaxID=667725 RepID=A0A0L0FVM0_9EUKA|nr:tyrosine aminotransferase [Sphaeroforma arctica JP610]KNC80684.1 tyrosine aminotransferase [Sphaeroforma arctica JP610]|eukprot:XP_014154586.1 tyrosine aminotransferase [Sphaeroforma arctica JP610]
MAINTDSTPRSGWAVESSIVAKRTFNPIRTVVDQMKIVPHPDKAMIALSIGDPTVFGNLSAPESAVEATIANVHTGKFNGYCHSAGDVKSRTAIAEYYTCENAPITVDDVIITSGCSGALDLAIGVLGNEGDNILVPLPGFSLYQTLAESKGMTVQHYPLLADSNWEVDLEALAGMIDNRTMAIVVNNPSNPCGSVYSKDHLKAILAVAEKNFVPIIADEIYADMAFEKDSFFPLASLESSVPILAVGGLAKRWLVPGWRVGWILINDRNNVFGKEVRAGLNSLTQLILGANTMAQSLIPAMLNDTKQDFYTDTLSTLQKHAQLSYEMISKIPGLTPVMPQGAMYMMVGIDVEAFTDLKTDMEMCQALITEESVFVLPGSCFQKPNFFRIVFTAPIEKLREAYERLAEFCEKHRK